MSPAYRETRVATFSAILTAVGVIASQIAGKAARDAIFLSTFAITDLPLMLMAASAVSIAMVLVSSRLMVRLGPIRWIPVLFGISSVTLLGVWGLMHVSVGVAAVLLYLHVTGFGVVLISGFWSVVNERFDPHTARKTISRIVGGATFGGLIGGVLAERLAASIDVTAILPVLAVLHLLCAWKVRDLAPRFGGEHRPAGGEPSRRRSSLQILRQESYLRNLAIIVITGTVAAALLDYVYKDYATRQFGDAGSLTRFFAWYYMGVGLLTFVVQAIASRKALEKMGLAQTVAVLPFVTAAGSLGALFVPNLLTATAARFSEAVLRSSLFRSGYELFFVPVPAHEKRATKTIIDVGFERLGDAVGGGLIKIILFAAPALALRVLLVVAAALALVGLLVSAFLKRGYVQALEQSLLSRGKERKEQIAGDAGTDSMILQTLTNLSIHAISRAAAEEERGGGDPAGASPADPSVVVEDRDLPSSRDAPASVTDPVARQVVELRSGRADRVRRILNDPPGLDPVVASHVIPLLAWDEVFPDAVQALRKVAAEITGQLTDALLNPREEFIIRRRVPLVLSASHTQRAFDGLLLGMNDKRFEVRFHASKALICVQAGNPEIGIDRESVFGAVLAELRVDEHMWRDRRVLDLPSGDCGLGYFDEVLQDHPSFSLEHVFTLLALVLERKPLQVAFRGLHTTDEMLKGTALEYLDVILPPHVRDALWPFLGDVGRKPPEKERDRNKITQNLLMSSMSIDANLAGLRKK